MTWPRRVTGVAIVLFVGLHAAHRTSSSSSQRSRSTASASLRKRHVPNVPRGRSLRLPFACTRTSFSYRQTTAELLLPLPLLEDCSRRAFVPRGASQAVLLCYDLDPQQSGRIQWTVLAQAIEGSTRRYQVRLFLFPPLALDVCIPPVPTSLPFRGGPARPRRNPSGRAGLGLDAVKESSLLGSLATWLGA